MRKRAPVGHGSKLAALSVTPEYYNTVSLSKSPRTVLPLIVPPRPPTSPRSSPLAEQTMDSATRACLQCQRQGTSSSPIQPTFYLSFRQIASPFNFRVTSDQHHRPDGQLACRLIMAAKTFSVS
jgi:hypothetical protein